jgi:two-component system cell cycle response regulator
VDDVQANLQLFKRWLVSEGCEVRTADSGDAALAAIAECHPDVVLLDVGIPRPDGFTVCQRLKQNPATNHIPVIIMTALHDATNEIRARELHADGYLNKPFDLWELRAQLDRILHRARKPTFAKPRDISREP